MNRLLKACLFVAVASATALPRPAWAQVTSGSISGIVTDESGGVLSGAAVEAIHEPTGTRYSAATGADGRFVILNVRVGPYTVTSSMTGFKAQKKSSLTVALGEEAPTSFKLKIESVSEAIEVTAESGIISSSATGPAANISLQSVENLPSVARSITDLARTSPYFAPQGGGNLSGTDVLVVAGRSNRYNNVQIDGANNNDLFGLAATSGNPGGYGGTQPISYDAIQEVQLVVAPYDIRQSGFTGGGVNAVTRSGTNAYHGTAYYEFRNNGLVGDGPELKGYNGNLVAAPLPFGKFDEKQFGASLGGPIVKDKVFFFVNADLTRNNAPSGYSADGSGGRNFGVPAADLTRALSIIRDTYHYDPSLGGDALGQFTKTSNSNKIFARLDFNLSPNHRLTIRDNWTKPAADFGGSGPTNSLFITPDSWYNTRTKQNQIVAQLDSTLGTSVNELRVAFQTIGDHRAGPTQFPQVTVDLTGGTCGSATCQIRFGTEQFSPRNELNSDIFELTDNFTIRRGSHLITIGTHNDIFKFKDLFIRDNFGTYRFSNLNNFAAGLAQQYDYSFSATSDPLQTPKFNVAQLALYAGDTWHVTPKFTLTYGVRVDKPIFPDKPDSNPAAVSNFGHRTDIAPSLWLFAPRVGFNLDVAGDGKTQVRGGAGVFAGRPPYVWLMNQYGNTGIDFTRIGASFNAANKIPFVADPLGPPKVVKGATAGTFSNEIDLVDPNFKYPEIFRGNVGVDRNLGWGIIATVEGQYANTLQDINYQNLNFAPTGKTRTSDGRPIFGKKVASLSDVMLLTNTTQGHSYTFVAQLSRPYRNGLAMNVGYLYGKSYAVNDGGSDQAASNWSNLYQPGDSNNPPESESRFSPGHRINAAVSYDWKFSPRVGLIASAYYNGMSGRPYTLLFLSDVNGDSKTSNDLVFIPASASDLNSVTNGTFAQLQAFIDADPQLAKYAGQILPRSALRSPWQNEVDLSAALRVPISGRSVEFKVDLLNLGNLINKNWGTVDYAPFNDIVPIGVSVDAATGKYNYNIATITNPNYVKFNRDDLRSRWQAAFTARVRF
jgi:hypothetical protein